MNTHFDFILSKSRIGGAALLRRARACPNHQIYRDVTPNGVTQDRNHGPGYTTNGERVSPQPTTQTHNRKSVMMKRTISRLVLAILGLVALTLGTTPAWAQLDDSAGTNAVVQLVGTIQTSGSLMRPVVIGIILFCGAIGVYYRLKGTAKVRG